ncbi:MAG: A24 family peptidase [Hyphomonadaceae bacterium]
MLLIHACTAVLAALLIAVSVIDLRTQRIPNWLNAVLAACGLGANFVLGRDLPAALIGMFAGFVLIWLLAELYFRLRGRDGLGRGDAKFMGAAGAWIGWMGLPFVLLLGSALGIVFVAGLRIAGRPVTRTHMFAFGPFLALGLFAVWAAYVYS